MNSDQNYFNEKKSILEQLISNGSQNLTPLLEMLLNEAMKLEREVALKAAPYERSSERMGYANGFKEREYASRLGTLKIQEKWRQLQKSFVALKLVLRKFHVALDSLMKNCKNSEKDP